jgi:hypothetical protein
MHPTPGEPMPTVSKDELRKAVAAVHSYFEELTRGLPSAFGLLKPLLENDVLPPAM